MKSLATIMLVLLVGCSSPRIGKTNSHQKSVVVSDTVNASHKGSEVSNNTKEKKKKDVALWVFVGFTLWAIISYEK